MRSAVLCTSFAAKWLASHPRARRGGRGSPLLPTEGPRRKEHFPYGVRRSPKQWQSQDALDPARPSGMMTARAKVTKKAKPKSCRVRCTACRSSSNWPTEPHNEDRASRQEGRQDPQRRLHNRSSLAKDRATKRGPGLTPRSRGGYQPDAGATITEPPRQSLMHG